MTRKNAFAIAVTAATLLTAVGAQAQSYPPRDDTEAPRGQDVQAPRQYEDVQAPRGTNEDIQAPRGDNEDLQAPRGDNEDLQAPRG